jgi:predicted nucleotidyltransferase
VGPRATNDSEREIVVDEKIRRGMKAVKILKRGNALTWEYDEEADVLYLSVGKPTKAVGVDVGGGAVVRYNKKKGVVGITLMGLRRRLFLGLDAKVMKKKKGTKTLLDQLRRERILTIAAKHGARNVRVFGSVARGEEGPDSDIYFLVEMEPGRSLLDLGGLQIDLQELLSQRVDVVTQRGLKGELLSRALRESKAL